MTIFQISNGCCYCGECQFDCPVQAITMDKGGAHINTDKCIGCGTCADNCASEAIKPIEVI